MRRDYGKAIEEASVALAEAMLEHQAELVDGALEVDREVLSLVRAVGASVLRTVFATLSETVTAAAMARGMRVHRQTDVEVWTVLGRVSVPSPYLRRV